MLKKPAAFRVTLHSSETLSYRVSQSLEFHAEVGQRVFKRISNFIRYIKKIYRKRQIRGIKRLA